MALHNAMLRLESMPYASPLHPGDIVAELKVGTLAAGTLELPTLFENGQILGVVFGHINNASVNSSVALSTDMVVTTGCITVVGPTASVAQFTALILGRPKI